MRLAQRRDFEPLGEAASDRKIRLENVNGTMIDQLGEIETCELAFSRSDRQQTRGAHFCKPRDVVGHYGFFDKSQFKFCRSAAESLRLRNIHRAVSVHHEVDLPADAFTGGAHSR